MENELPLNTSPKISRGNIIERGGIYYQNISYSYIKGTEIKVKLQGRTREDVERSVEEFIKTL